MTTPRKFLTFLATAIAIAAMTIAGAATAQTDSAPTRSEVRTSIKLRPGVDRGPIRIEADDVVIDGQGAVIDGGGRMPDSTSFRDVGIVAVGKKGVVLKNLRVLGFKTAFQAEGCRGFTIENCDFSDNYDDPNFGWGDGEPSGGMILRECTGFTIEKSKMSRNWNGIAILGGGRHRVLECDASHCSNVCAKLERACDNRFERSNFSYGLRISPGEVHARDSTGVLLESGSDRNVFFENDITHGGDGVFIRVLNGWCSRFNLFEGNDCSYANNNAFESWSPDNVFIRNKANHSSYGFWLGGSDRTTLIGNEAAWNGLSTGFHNAPESDFRHGGIVIVHGSGSHSLIKDNWCHDNAGSGIALRGDLATRGEKWRIFDVTIDGNRLEKNDVGIFARFAHRLILAGNKSDGNKADEAFEEVSGIVRTDRRFVVPTSEKSPTAPIFIAKGSAIALTASSCLSAFDFSTAPEFLPKNFSFFVQGPDQARSVETIVGDATNVRPERPGLYRVVFEASDDARRFSKGYEVWVRPDEGEAESTESNVEHWSVSSNSPRSRSSVELTGDRTVVGKKSVALSVDDLGESTTLRLDAPKGRPFDFSKTKSIGFWMSAENENTFGFSGPNPIVRLRGQDGAFQFIPLSSGRPANLFSDVVNPESRAGWQWVEIDPTGNGRFSRVESLDGKVPPTIDGDLEMTTHAIDVATQESTAMAALGDAVYLLVSEADRLFRIAPSFRAEELASPSTIGATGAWWNGDLAAMPSLGAKGALLSARRQRGADGKERAALARYDLETGKWSWIDGAAYISHAAVPLGDRLYGLCHARMGNYGGAFVRVSFEGGRTKEERTMPGGHSGPDRDWWSRAAQIAAHDGKLYLVKNDWTSPQPKVAGEIGDRLMVCDPADFSPSVLSPGSDPEEGRGWKESRTKVSDLGPLPFEIGQGAALVALPKNWSTDVGESGGLFLVAGTSPSDHEGQGTPSAEFAIHDIASGKWRVGRLPGPTGTATSAVFSDGRVLIKRGGVNFAPSNSELFSIRPIPRSEAESRRSEIEKRRVDLSSVTAIEWQFTSSGPGGYRVRIDGLMWR